MTTKSKTTIRRVPGSPELIVTHGVSGTLACAIKGGCKGGSTQIEITEGDPTVEANWRVSGDGIYTLSKFLLTGLQPATRYFLRARCYSSGGSGPWSNYVTIICL